MSTRRDMLPRVSSRQTVMEQRTANQETAQYVFKKTADAIPELIELAQSVVEIKKIEAQADSMVKVMREQAEIIKSRAEVFVREEMARRETLQTKGGQVQAILQQLQVALHDQGASDEIKKLLIPMYQEVIQKLLSE